METLPLRHSRLMPGIGKDCHGLHINDLDQAWPVVYAIEAKAAVIRPNPPRPNPSEPLSGGRIGIQGREAVPSEARGIACPRWPSRGEPDKKQSCVAMR